MRIEPHHRIALRLGLPSLLAFIIAAGAMLSLDTLPVVLALPVIVLGSIVILGSLAGIAMAVLVLSMPHIVRRASEGKGSGSLFYRVISTDTAQRGEKEADVIDED